MLATLTAIGLGVGARGFQGWRGACSGAGSRTNRCELTVDEDTVAIANHATS